MMTERLIIFHYMQYSRASPGLGRRGLALLGRHGRFARRAAAGLDEAAPGPRRAGVRAGGRGGLGLATRLANIRSLHGGVLDLGISNYIISTSTACNASFRIGP